MQPNDHFQAVAALLLGIRLQYPLCRRKGGPGASPNVVQKRKIFELAGILSLISRFHYILPEPEYKMFISDKLLSCFINQNINHSKTMFNLHHN
jgi:hypothetical protein